MPVVHCKRQKYDVYIGRPSKWGNPFVIGKDGTRQQVIDKYREWIINRLNSGIVTKDELAALRGKTLGCWCAPAPCHGDVLLELSEQIT